MRPATTVSRAATTRWPVTPPYGLPPRTSSPYSCSAASATSASAIARWVGAAEESVRDRTRPGRQRRVPSGHRWSPAVTMVGAWSMPNPAFSQPFGRGRLMPLSWSTRKAPSSSGPADGSDAGPSAEPDAGPGVDGAGTGGAGAVREEAGGAAGAPSPPGRRRTAEAASAATASAAAAIRTARPPNRFGGTTTAAGRGPCAGRVCPVHAVPSHQRSTAGAVGSGYQPGGVVVLMRSG
ncbi:hypothetical protein LUX05_01700 [Streptomyces somaliensis]|nr:hypothetical protein [Streptomyces somaliensis]